MAAEELSAEPVELTVAEEDRDKRLDVLLAERFSSYSRVHLGKVIKAGGVRVDRKPAKPSHRLQPGEVVEVRLPPLPRVPRLLLSSETCVLVSPLRWVIRPASVRKSSSARGAIRASIPSAAPACLAARR